MNKSEIRVIFVDIDNTILNHGIHDWDHESLLALKTAQKNGVEVFFATARPFESVCDTGIFSIFNPDGFVCTNGAVAYYHNRLIYEKAFPQEVVKECLRIADKYKLVLEISDSRDRWLTKKNNKLVDEYFGSFNEVLPPIRKYNGENISAMLLFAPEELDEKIQAEVPQNVNLVRFCPWATDLHYFHLDKTYGMKCVMKKLKVKYEEALSIGDESADAAMFEITKYSACMGNGKQDAKEKATFVTTHINEHGVKEALKHFKII